MTSRPYLLTTVLCVVSLIGMVKGMEMSNSNISNKKENIHERDRLLAALVDERIWPGLAGTQLAAQPLVLYLIASYLRSPHLPHLTTVFPHDHHNRLQKVSLLTGDRTAITVDSNNQIIEYEIQTGTPINQFTNHEFVIHLHANSSYLIGFTGDVLQMSKKVHVWDRTTGECLRNLYFYNENLIALQIFPDQHRLENIAVLVMADGIYLWMNDTTKAILENNIDIHMEAIFSPGAEYVALQRYAERNKTIIVEVWQISPSWELFSRFIIDRTNAKNSVALRAMSVAKALLAVVDRAQNAVALWDYIRQKSVLVTSGHSGVPRDCAFSTEARFLVVGESTRLTVWEVDTGDILLQFPESILWAERCSFVANNSLLLVYPDDSSHSQGCRVRDVSCLYYNDLETMHYTFFRSLVELYIHSCFRTLQ